MSCIICGSEYATYRIVVGCKTGVYDTNNFVCADCIHKNEKVVVMYAQEGDD